MAPTRTDSADRESVLAGHEEARLIYLGVARTTPFESRPGLVLALGGGSTELIVGEGLESRLGYSQELGTVPFSMHHFPGGRRRRRLLREHFRDLPAEQAAVGLRLGALLAAGASSPSS